MSVYSGMMLRSNQARKNLQPPALDGEVVEAALERNAAHFDNTHAATLRAVVNRQLLQMNDTVGYRVKLKISLR